MDIQLTKMDIIPFQTIDWTAVEKTEHPGESGFAICQSIVYKGFRIRLVEYSKNYLADHWCQNGHIVYCLEGDFESELKNGNKMKLSSGMSYIVSDSSNSHRSYSEQGVKLLIIDGRFLGSRQSGLVEAQMDALHAQMNPHLIFNALNSIDSLILHKHTLDASKYLSKFAMMVRLTLDHSKRLFVSINETVEYLQSYLDIERLRFGNSFTYLIETPNTEKGMERQIPSLMIQPLVANAIWHGLIPKTGNNKMLVIRFEVDHDFVTCSIDDNGIGINQSSIRNQFRERRQAGIVNLQKRIKIMNEEYNLNCSLNIIDTGEQNIFQTGTSAVLRFKEPTSFKNEFL